MLAFGSGIKILASRFSKHLSSNSNPRSLVLRALRPRKLMTSSVGGPVQIDIVNRLSVALEPLHLAIENESYKHSVPKGSETHFKVIVVSDKFEGLALIDQHKLVNETLAENLRSGVHALAIKTMTPKKWQALYESNPTAEILQTPNCLGGSKHDKKKS